MWTSCPNSYITDPVSIINLAALMSNCHHTDLVSNGYLTDLVSISNLADLTSNCQNMDLVSNRHFADLMSNFYIADHVSIIFFADEKEIVETFQYFSIVRSRITSSY